MDSDALVSVVRKLRNKALPFGIGTPRAQERTAFEENEGPDARSVVKGEFLDIENQPDISAAFIFSCL
jgi:hypothetical protein